MTLFGEISEPQPHEVEHGPFVQVAIEQSLDKVLDYHVPPKLLERVAVGVRVKVPLGRGNRAAFGYVVAVTGSTSHPRTKPILAVDDDRVLIHGRLLELARWMSRYYCTPLGQVIQTIIPSAVKKRIGIGFTIMVRAKVDHAELQKAIESTRTRKRRAILARLLQLPENSAIELIRLAGDAGVTAPTIRKAASTGLIEVFKQQDVESLTPPPDVGGDVEADLDLNPDQAHALNRVASRIDDNRFSVTLLHGVTGSGKTEVYLQAIRKVVQAGRQAIVIVPEIALTPQTVRRFTRRFARVAIMHSGLTGTQRHQFWQQIATGHADVVVGARSAVFAPLPNVGIIVVDEEHEASYKQDTAPRYHGRDVAIKRAQLLNVPIVLGSATPSLEIWHRVNHASASTARSSEPPGPAQPEGSAYELLKLPNRVRGLSLPKVELVDMKQDLRSRKGVHLIGQRLEALLRHTLSNDQQAILLLNRRGYSNFVYCPSCQHLMTCKYCDTTMTYHRSLGERVASAAFEKGVHTGQLHCHYCLAVNPLPEKCPACGKKMSLFGLGTQRVEEELARKFPELRFARVDSDSMRSTRDYEQVLSKFARREIHVLLGTQMIAKGLDYPNVTLVGVINGDTALSLPDFRASERTFQLITQVAGRAGRGDHPGRVVLQTFVPDDATIQFALRQDFESFAAHELKMRQEVGLPPYSRMVRIVVRDIDPDKVLDKSERVAQKLREANIASTAGVSIKGPYPCAISRIAGHYRYQIVMSHPSAGAVQEILMRAREGGDLATSDKIAVDVDPVSLL